MGKWEKISDMASTVRRWFGDVEVEVWDDGAGYAWEAQTHACGRAPTRKAAKAAAKRAGKLLDEAVRKAEETECDK